MVPNVLIETKREFFNEKIYWLNYILNADTSAIFLIILQSCLSVSSICVWARTFMAVFNECPRIIKAFIKLNHNAIFYVKIYLINYIFIAATIIALQTLILNENILIIIRNTKMSEYFYL
jgi:hypothetical protein